MGEEGRPVGMGVVRPEGSMSTFRRAGGLGLAGGSCESLPQNTVTFRSVTSSASADPFQWGGLATGRCGGYAQASRQAKHCAHKGILMLWSCDKAFQDPCHSETKERKYAQQRIRICTHGVKTGLG